MMGKMKKYVYLSVLAASILLTIHLFRETRQLQSRVQQLEEERKRVAHAEFVSAWVDISEPAGPEHAGPGSANPL